MRLFLVAVLLIACFSTGKAQSFVALDKKYGFRDLKFETDTTAISGLTRLYAREGEVYYKRATDSLKIGDAPLSEITYHFFQGKLVGVQFSSSEGLRTRQILEELYGRAIQSQTSSRFYNWSGFKVALSMMREADGSATFFMDSRAMKKIVDKYQKEQAKKAKADL